MQQVFISCRASAQYSENHHRIIILKSSFYIITSLYLNMSSSFEFGSIEVLRLPNQRPAHATARAPSRTVLQPGHCRTENSRPIEVPTILEADYVLTMRDGVKIRADIYRPVTDELVPAIVMWGPYGKSGSGKIP